jgi:hypothetical protein
MKLCIQLPNCNHHKILAKKQNVLGQVNGNLVLIESMHKSKVQQG